MLFCFLFSFLSIFSSSSFPFPFPPRRPKEPPPPFVADGGPRQRLEGQREHGIYRSHLRQARVEAKSRVEPRRSLRRSPLRRSPFSPSSLASSSLLSLFLLHAVPQQAQASHAEERVVNVRGVLGPVSDPTRVPVLSGENKPRERRAVDPADSP